MTSRILLLAAFLCITISCMTGCSSTMPDIRLPEPTILKGVRIEVDKAYREASYFAPTVGVSGIATNETGRDLQVLTIEFGAYDADGVKIASANAISGFLNADGKWRFDALFHSTIDRKYQYDEIKLENINGVHNK